MYARRMRDPFAPRRPWNAYAFFVSCNQELLKSQMPNKTQCERMRVIAVGLNSCMANSSEGRRVNMHIFAVSVFGVLDVNE